MFLSSLCGLLQRRPGERGGWGLAKTVVVSSRKGAGSKREWPPCLPVVLELRTTEGVGPMGCRSPGTRESGLAGQEVVARDVWT